MAAAKMNSEIRKIIIEKNIPCTVTLTLSLEEALIIRALVYNTSSCTTFPEVTSISTALGNAGIPALSLVHNNPSLFNHGREMITNEVTKMRACSSDG